MATIPRRFSQIDAVYWPILAHIDAVERSRCWAGTSPTRLNWIQGSPG